MGVDAGSRATNPQRIDHFFAMPGARADRWRDLHKVAQDWARGRGDQSAAQAALSDIVGYEAFFAYPGKALLSTLQARIEPLLLPLLAELRDG